MVGTVVADSVERRYQYRYRRYRAVVCTNYGFLAERHETSEKTGIFKA